MATFDFNLDRDLPNVTPVPAPRWGMGTYTFAPVATIPPPLKVGDSVYLLPGRWKIHRSIVTEIVHWDPRTSEFEFNRRPVTKADPPPDRKFIRAMRIGRAKRVIRERARRLVGLPVPGWGET